jgi:hypothetical protein
MKVWDTRLPDPCVHTLSLPDKVYTMDATDDRVVIGMNNRRVLNACSCCFALRFFFVATVPMSLYASHSTENDRPFH